MLIDTHMPTYERQVLRARAIMASKDTTLAAVRRGVTLAHSLYVFAQGFEHAGCRTSGLPFRACSR